jgi:hypothetical protein
MRYLSILPLLLITALLWGQDTDQKRMKRDLEVAEKILNELLEENSSSGFRPHVNEGAYIDGFGVLFTIRSPWGGMGLYVSPEIALDWDRENKLLRGKARAEADDQKATTVYRLKRDSLDQMDMARFKQVTETFFADYAYLLSKVPANEKICIKYAQGGGSAFAWGDAAFGIAQAGSKGSTPGLTAVVRQQAIQDYRMEKIDRKSLVNKIEYTEDKGMDPEQDRELTLLHSIFNRLYQSDLGNGFYITPNAQLEKIPGLGAVLTYQFTTRTNDFFMSNEFGSYTLRGDRRNGRITIAKADDEKEEEEEKEPLDFGAFLDDFKSNVIEYGSTVRNLKPDEVLSFQLNIPDCDCENDDEWAESIKIVAKQSLLERYRKGDIDLDEAVGQLQVTKIDE